MEICFGEPCADVALFRPSGVWLLLTVEYLHLRTDAVQCRQQIAAFASIAQVDSEAFIFSVMVPRDDGVPIAAHEVRSDETDPMFMSRVHR